MLPFAFEVNNFFPFRETFVSPWSQSFFFNREERLCSPSLSKSTTFFRFVKLSFHRGASRFSSIARSVYAPLRFRSQPFFSFPRKFFSLAFPLTVFPCREGGKCLKGPRKSSNKCKFLQNNLSISAQTGQQRGSQPTAPQPDVRPCAGSFRPRCSSASGHPHSHCRCGRSSTRYRWPVRYR